MTRWGTTYKLQSIKNHYKKYNDFVVEYVGIAADEQGRLLRERRKICSNKLKLYPLAEWQMTEKDCLDYCYKKWLELARKRHRTLLCARQSFLLVL